MSDSEILEFLGIEERPVLSLFIEEVANKGLQQYQRVVQYGVHKGQSLYNHIVSGVFLIHSLQEILNLSSTELKILTIAFCIHDINKTYQGNETSYGKIAVPKNVVQEIEKIGFDAFSEDWRDYIEDITELIRGHSGHNSVRGDSLDRRSDPTKLGKRRLTELDEIIRAADVADLSQSYSERKHKLDFLSHLNRFTVQQYQLIAHQVTEQRGMLTNIIHNQVSEFLQEKFNALPIFLYPQGTHYLVGRSVSLSLSNEDLVSIGQGVKQKINTMKRELYSDFIGKNQNQGIKIDAEIMDLKLPYSEIFGYVNFLIQKKVYNVKETEEKCKDSLISSLTKIAKDADLSIQGLLAQSSLNEFELTDPKMESKTKQKKKKKKCMEIDDEDKPILKEWVEGRPIISEDLEKLRLGELLRTFVIFLGDHCKDIINDSWVHVYNLLKIKNYTKYDLFEARYRRAYVVAQNISIDFYDLLNLVIEEANSLKSFKQDSDEDTVEDSKTTSDHGNAIIKYVADNISFDFSQFSLSDFQNNLKVYCENNHKQSCYASSISASTEWRSPTAPEGIKVQQFSNRLLGGDFSSVKRNIDPIVQQQFTIEKLNYSARERSLYLHIMPYSFMTAPFIESFKSLFRKLSTIDVSAVSLSIKEAIQFFSNQKYCVLPIKHQKAGGILVPKFSDLVGNVISLPLNPLGNNQTEKYLNAIEYALLLYKRFGVKILLSELAFPIMNLTESQEIDIFLDGVPSLLRGLVPSENLYFCRDKNSEPLGSGDILWQRLHAIREMYDLLWLNETKENELLAMAEAFSGGEGQIFFVVDRLIEKKAAHISKRSKQGIDKDSAARGLTRKLKTWMDQIVMSGSNV